MAYGVNVERVRMEKKRMKKDRRKDVEWMKWSKSRLGTEIEEIRQQGTHNTFAIKICRAPYH